MILMWVHCHVGSLEKSTAFASTQANVHGHVDSLENMNIISALKKF